MQMTRLALLLPLFLTPACGDGHVHDADGDHAHEGEEAGHEGHDHGDEKDEGHHHAAPHDGTLVVFGEEFAHVEILLDAKSGRLDLYVLDGSAEAGVRLKHESLALSVDPGAEGAMELSLAALESVGTGETVGDSSHFSITDERLKGLDHFQAVLRSISIKGQTFSDVTFKYPEGNE